MATRIVYIHNYGCDDYVDACNGQEVVIKANECLPMAYDEAIFLAGDGTAEDKMRASFRRGGVSPTLSVYETMPKASVFMQNVSVAKKVVVANVPDQAVIPGGRYAGKKWESVLSPQNFDKSYWKKAMYVMAKSIPLERKEQITLLLQAD